MMPPHDGGLTQHFQREIVHVQNYIQSRLQTEDAYLLGVNAADVEAYTDEIQNYVKQKQLQQQVRRPMATSDKLSARSLETPKPTPTGVSTSPVQAQPKRASERSSPYTHPAQQQATRVVASHVSNRLPGVEWLLAPTQLRTGTPLDLTASAHHLQHHSLYETPILAVPRTHVHGFAAHHHRVLKKQKTM